MFAVPGVGNGPSPRSIVTGPDGNLWFTNEAGSSIGRITVAGAITIFPVFLVPPAGLVPAAITAGPDGNLWFTNTQGTVDRITPAGVHTSFPGAVMGPTGIVSGPDGNLWFTDETSSVGRISPAGTLTRFADPASLAIERSPQDRTGTSGTSVRTRSTA